MCKFITFSALIASVISGGLAEQVQEFPDDDDEAERDIFEQEAEDEDDPIEAMKGMILMSKFKHFTRQQTFAVNKTNKLTRTLLKV